MNHILVLIYINSLDHLLIINDFIYDPLLEKIVAR